MTPSGVGDDRGPTRAHQRRGSELDSINARRSQLWGTVRTHRNRTSTPDLAVVGDGVAHRLSRRHRLATEREVQWRGPRMTPRVPPTLPLCDDRYAEVLGNRFPGTPVEMTADIEHGSHRSVASPI